MTNPGRVVIIGAGPTGLGAAHRLAERGHDTVTILERETHVGGLAASFTDEKGFTWDVGGHVQFSHYEYFDRLMDDLLPGEWLDHERESWIRIRGRFVPYPFQYNIRHLPPEDMRRCLSGLLRLCGAPPRQPTDFDDWLMTNFGEGLTDIFMRPYNFKTWAYPPHEMGCGWMGERVARVDLERLVFNIIDGRDDLSWGPNNTFRFPRTGGTGEIWRRLARRLPPRWLRTGTDVAAVDTARKIVRTAAGDEHPYDVLISTMPLDLFLTRSDLADVQDTALAFLHSRVHVIGLGIEGQPPPDLAKKCWMYFPEDTVPAFRVTVFSNYSPGNVPDPSRTWSLMAEVSESPAKPVDAARVVDHVIAGLHTEGLLPDPDAVVDRWTFTTGHGYPTPFLGRDPLLDRILPLLDARGILSRGRFGAWKYEVSNQDHSLMQGVEAVDRLLDGTPEITVNDPNAVNRPGKRTHPTSAQRCHHRPVKASGASQVTASRSANARTAEGSSESRCP